LVSCEVLEVVKRARLVEKFEVFGKSGGTAAQRGPRTGRASELLVGPTQHQGFLVLAQRVPQHVVTTGLWWDCEVLTKQGMIGSNYRHMDNLYYELSSNI
jgi:hypothetical protein